MKQEEREAQESREYLKKLIQPGDTVYTIVKHVSASGMTRDISCYIVADEKIVWIDWNVSKVTGFRYNKAREAVRVGGCGMDMGFHIVYALGRCLWADEEWECSGDNCPFNEHFNDSQNYPRKKGLKHKGDSGYTLNHKWL